MSRLGDLLAELGAAPRLDGALCKGKPELWDEPSPTRRDSEPDDTVARIEEAISTCHRCPALRACERWLASLQPSKRPIGVVAGRMQEPVVDSKIELVIIGETATITARVLVFVDGRSETEAADLAQIGVVRSQAAPVLTRLADAGRIRRVGRGRYAPSTGARATVRYACGRPTSKGRSCRNEVGAAGEGCEFHATNEVADGHR